jgi:hypothetical protein
LSRVLPVGGALTVAVLCSQIIHSSSRLAHSPAHNPHPTSMSSHCEAAVNATVSYLQTPTAGPRRDGNWIAGRSAESARAEVYVESFLTEGELPPAGAGRPRCGATIVTSSIAIVTVKATA